MMNDAISARVTTSSGQYRSGVVEHPRVTPASYRPSTIDQSAVFTSPNSPCGGGSGGDVVEHAGQPFSHFQPGDAGRSGRHAPSTAHVYA